MFCTRFDHAGADGITFFTEFEILHATFVIIKEIGFCIELLSVLGLGRSPLSQLTGDAIRVTLEQGGFSRVMPTLGGLRIIGVIKVGGTMKML